MGSWLLGFLVVEGCINDELKPLAILSALADVCANEVEAAELRPLENVPRGICQQVQGPKSLVNGSEYLNEDTSPAQILPAAHGAERALDARDVLDTNLW